MTAQKSAKMKKGGSRRPQTADKGKNLSIVIPAKQRASRDR